MSASHHHSQRRTVLVVEDEELLRSLAVDALRDARFDVLEAGQARDALSILRQRAESIQAVFTDVHMPGEMNGVGLAHAAHRSWPWIGLLIASGQLMPHRDDLPPRSRFLPKPYMLHHVVSHLHALVGV